MNNEVRKPRVFKNVVHVKTHSMEGVVSVTHEINLLPFKIDLQEILPGDDSIRVSREEFNILLKEIKIIKRKNGPAVNSSHNVTLVEDLLERIERESKGE